MNPFLRYVVDKNSAHRHTDRHTPMTTRPCGLRRAGNYGYQLTQLPANTGPPGKWPLKQTERERENDMQ